MLAGCGKVCIRRTAQSSTNEFGSRPSDGSRHNTKRSLQSIPISGRGVSSGERQSTDTFVASPCESSTSKFMLCLRTTRVRSNGPSIIRRLWGWTRGLGNLPLILACQWTSLFRDSASRFSSFMFVARAEISCHARYRGSSYVLMGAGVIRESSSNYKFVDQQNMKKKFLMMSKCYTHQEAIARYSLNRQ